MRWQTRAFVADTMGTTASLHIRTPESGTPGAASDSALAAAAEQAFDILRRADRVFSPYRADSDLLRIRRGALAESAADPWYAPVRALCTEAGTATGGLFTSELTGPDGTRGYDPTGLVKGWATERAAAGLRQVPGIVFCLNVGGDLVAGHGPDADPAIPRAWRVGIADPTDPGQVSAVLEISDGALATSGTAQRGSHIIDPRTGTPARSTLASVTVVGPDLTWADVWATAAFVDPNRAAARMPAAYEIAARVPATATVLPTA
ncbi:FAD:protein FMN transferase [Granulicoccus phenolivorans]|uniref:FAD:protein FMN transferase n=1 Tax=Granulicoccus phenolivorans TaxID=266854 RepID=UPI0003FFF82D|nr:FAD:protein FMN transferase [Granulicoccus phenolivorans]